MQRGWGHSSAFLSKQLMKAGGVRAATVGALLTICPSTLQHPATGHQVPHLSTHSETESWRGLAPCFPGRHRKGP